jgi:hypothetical protein
MYRATAIEVKVLVPSDLLYLFVKSAPIFLILILSGYDHKINAEICPVAIPKGHSFSVWNGTFL